MVKRGMEKKRKARNGDGECGVALWNKVSLHKVKEVNIIIECGSHRSYSKYMKLAMCQALGQMLYQHSVI